MKVFISWSGERSRQVAELLNVWIQCVLQAVDPWLSTRDIDKGSLWFSEITNQLSNTQNGIVCLSKANLDNPWILFEAGALAKGLSSNRVYTFLIDLEPVDVKDPLAQFNHTKPSRESVFQLIRSINKSLNDQALRENIISNVFETYWPQFEQKFAQILRETSLEEVRVERPKEDILDEILSSVRTIDKRLRKVEDFEFKTSDNLSFSASNINSTNTQSRLMKFEKCPNCGNYETGYSIYKCKNCGGFYCWKQGGFLASDSGCGAGEYCPQCHQSKNAGLFSDSVKKVGRIKKYDK